MTDDSFFWMVEVIVPEPGFAIKSKYYYFDEWTKADQFYRGHIHGAGMRIKPRSVTCFDIIQNPGEMR